jgi:hypothetical protein
LVNEKGHYETLPSLGELAADTIRRIRNADDDPKYNLSSLLSVRMEKLKEMERAAAEDKVSPPPLPPSSLSSNSQDQNVDDTSKSVTSSSSSSSLSSQPSTLPMIAPGIIPIPILLLILLLLIIIILILILLLPQACSPLLNKATLLHKEVKGNIMNSWHPVLFIHTKVTLLLLLLLLLLLILPLESVFAHF